MFCRTTSCVCGASFKLWAPPFKLDRILMCGYRRQLSTPSDSQSAKSKDENDTDANISLVARILHQRGKTGKDQTGNSLSHKSSSFRLKLQELASEVESASKGWSVKNDEQSQLMNDPGKQEDFQEVEMLAAEEEFQSKPKLSPLLGTEDPTIPSSDKPCTGCGAALQCHNRTLPGFLPSERFKMLTNSELKTSICQRCYYMKFCDAFVEVSTNPEDFGDIISKIKPTRSVVVMVIDLMDIQGSIVPYLSDYIGTKHPLVIVANKADLLAPDDPEYLKRVQEEIKEACTHHRLTNIKKIALVSAKTGYGIERLINILFSFYKSRVDIFIVGTANAGKSSLFNTLLASDYCKHTARDLIDRATVSVWPGTTLNLLKFPIMRPSSRTVTLRNKRLKQEVAMRKELLKQARARKKTASKDKEEFWELREEIKLTDVRTDGQKEKDIAGHAWGQDIVSYIGSKDGRIQASKEQPVQEHFEAENFSTSYWMYDTPGVINPDQILNLLTPEESAILSPGSLIIPRCVLLQPGETLFISGLSRLDFVKGDKPLIATVHVPHTLPLKVVPTQDANDYYQQHVGTPELGLPLGDQVRLSRLPSLIGKEFHLENNKGRVAVADIQMSSIGWVSVSPETTTKIQLRLFTPGRKGISLRQPSLLPHFLGFKGKRISQTPFFRTISPTASLGRTIDSQSKLSK